MARPRQPVELVALKGKKHLTKAEINERKNSEIKAFSDNIEPPSYLPQNLQEEFKRLADELIRIEIMSNLDSEALARFVVSEYQYQRVVKKSLKIGADNDEYDKLLNRQEKLFKMCRQAATDLGLTISSRCKLVIPKAKDEKPANKFSKFM